MLERVRTVWKDPVGSKLIAGAIATIFLAAWRTFGRSTFDAFNLWMRNKVELPIWLLLVCSLVVAAAIWNLRPKRKPPEPQKTLITNILDASARIDSWWPKAVGQFPDDVHVDYAELEDTFSLAPELAKSAVSIVAHKRYYKEKIAGDRHASFEYDHDRIYRG